jgi:hypothetical protein
MFPTIYRATNNVADDTRGLMSGFCNSAIVEQQAAAGSPEAVSIPAQYSLPGYEFPSHA